MGKTKRTTKLNWTCVAWNSDQKIYLSLLVQKREGGGTVGVDGLILLNYFLFLFLFTKCLGRGKGDYIQKL